MLTAWAVDSYLDLKHNGVFDKKEYEQKLRPDVMLLKGYPNEPKFNNSKFWSVVDGPRGSSNVRGFKMKWHNIGNGKVQLRLPVGITTEALLCAAYVKHTSSQEKRMLAKFKVYLQLIQQDRYTECGRMS